MSQYPKGFLFNGTSAGIKTAGLLDLGLIYSEYPCDYAGLFTISTTKAPPVKVCQARLGNKIQAIVVNSKNANAFTGERGLSDAIKMTSTVEKELKLKEGSALPFSTGVIGEYLPMDKVKKGLLELCQKIKEGNSNPELFAKTILTTDTKTKEMSVEITIDDKTVTLYGCAKGSGMIYPNMATMLAYVVSDVTITKPLLMKALKECNDVSFNAISVDGDMSTNDSLVVLANGRAENSIINKEDESYHQFKSALKEICIHLAKEIVLDGEGATKFIEICVKGAASQEDANQCSSQLANSLLVKTAFFGEDANWGRFVGAIGASGAQTEESKLDIKMGTIQLVKNGERADFTEEETSQYMKNHDLYLEVNLNLGNYFKTIFTTDLSYDYVKINADYRT